MYDFKKEIDNYMSNYSILHNIETDQNIIDFYNLGYLEYPIYKKYTRFENFTSNPAFVKQIIECHNKFKLYDISELKNALKQFKKTKKLINTKQVKEVHKMLINKQLKIVGYTDDCGIFNIRDFDLIDFRLNLNLKEKPSIQKEYASTIYFMYKLCDKYKVQNKDEFISLFDKNI